MSDTENTPINEDAIAEELRKELARDTDKGNVRGVMRPFIVATVETDRPIRFSLQVEEKTDTLLSIEKDMFGNTINKYEYLLQAINHVFRDRLGVLSRPITPSELGGVLSLATTFALVDGVSPNPELLNSTLSKHLENISALVRAKEGRNG